MTDDCTKLLVCEDGVPERRDVACSDMSECNHRDGVEKCYCKEGARMTNPDYDLLAGEQVLCEGNNNSNNRKQ